MAVWLASLAFFTFEAGRYRESHHPPMRLLVADERMERLRPFPKSHSKPRVNDRRVLSGSFSSVATGCGGTMLRRIMSS
jgi:hypothetical protein